METIKTYNGWPSPLRNRYQVRANDPEEGCDFWLTSCPTDEEAEAALARYRKAGYEAWIEDIETGLRF